MNFLDTLSVNNMADFYQFSETGFIIEYCLLILFLIFITVTIGFLSKKVALTSFAGGCAIVLILIITFLYNEYNYVFYLLSALYASFILLVVFINLGSLRKFFAFKNPNAPKAKKGKPEISKIFNKEELYDVIEKTVKSLSRSKTGAIITFQRNDDLKYLIKNGVSLKCDVSQELLETIFYPGTRLHDGAVIIKDDKIIKASVYYTLTTPLFQYTGEFFLRLAAFFISAKICIMHHIPPNIAAIYTHGRMRIHFVGFGSFLKVFSGSDSVIFFVKSAK